MSRYRLSNSNGAFVTVDARDERHARTMIPNSWYSTLNWNDLPVQIYVTKL